MAEALKILVVDDSPAIRTVLGVILGAAGHDVVFAENVDCALELHGLQNPDIVLTDYNMPGRTGRELVASLREAGFDIPIFVISSEQAPEIRAAMASAGANGWFQKPVCVPTLLAALNAVRRGFAYGDVRRGAPQVQAAGA